MDITEFYETLSTVIGSKKSVWDIAEWMNLSHGFERKPCAGNECWYLFAMKWCQTNTDMLAGC